MRGELIGVWSATWQEIWTKLARHPHAPEDLFCEIYREFTDALVNKPNAQELADIVDDPKQARERFRKAKSKDFSGELSLVAFFEGAYDVLEDLGGDRFANRYFNLVQAFIDKYSLRYDLRRPFTLCPTLPGVFSKLICELKEMTKRTSHLDRLMKDFEDSVRDLRSDCSGWGESRPAFKNKLICSKQWGGAVPE